MNRRDFLKGLMATSAIAVVAKTIPCEDTRYIACDIASKDGDLMTCVVYRRRGSQMIIDDIHSTADPYDPKLWHMVFSTRHYEDANEQRRIVARLTEGELHAALTT